MHWSPRHAVTLAVALGLGVAACATTQRPAEVSLSSASARVAAPAGEVADVTTVVAVSIDGLNPRAIRDLGAEGTPTLHRLVAEGATTLNARTVREQTNTLPNHTSQITSRRIRASKGGHGVTWNDERLRPRTVQQAAGHRVRSVFSVVDSPARDTALFATKQKFTLFERSWDEAIDKFLVRADNRRLVRRVRADIDDKARAFRFVHLSGPDLAGHKHGFMSEEYLDAVSTADRLVGRILDQIEAEPDLAGHTVLVVTSDHGGDGPSHRDPTELVNFRIPFLVWGAGVAAGADLYDLNPDYADPGEDRTAYGDERQPVRNAALANLVTDLLGLDPVKGSEFDVDHDLDVN